MAYPSSLDELTDGVPSDGAAPNTALGDATYPHDDHHRALAVAVEAVEAELGTDPAGASATVKARLDAVDSALAARQPLDSDLTAIAALSTTAYGRGLLELANQAALLSAVGSATDSASGVAELATTAETQTGTDTGRVVTPAGLAAVNPPHILSVGSGLTASVGVPGVPFSTASTGAITAGRDYYAPFQVRRGLTITFAQVDVSTGPASDATIYVGIYAATNDDQPTGAPLLNTTIACAASATGVKSASSLSAPLPPGNYVAAFNTSVNLTLRVYGSNYGTHSATLGTGPSFGFALATRAAGAFTDPPTAWNSNALAGGAFVRYHSLFFRWTTP